MAVRLRELKDQIGITTTALARKTAYSRSSWTRCLGGTAVPPSTVVETLGTLAGMSPQDADMARLLVLRELAEQARTGPHAPRSADAPTDARSRTGVVAAAAVGCAAVAVAGVAVVWTTAARPAPVTPASLTSVPCDYTDLGGRWFAGHSATSVRLVARGSSGQDVTEVQCLLDQHGVDPGAVDGLFGPRTEQAVRQLQRAAGIVADGIVGPQTWAVLRR